MDEISKLEEKERVLIFDPYHIEKKKYQMIMSVFSNLYESYLQTLSITDFSSETSKDLKTKLVTFINSMKNVDIKELKNAQEIDKIIDSMIKLLHKRLPQMQKRLEQEKVERQLDKKIIENLLHQIKILDEMGTLISSSSPNRSLMLEEYRNKWKQFLATSEVLKAEIESLMKLDSNAIA